MATPYFVPRTSCGRSGAPHSGAPHSGAPQRPQLTDGVPDALTDSLRRLRDTTSPAPLRQSVRALPLPRTTGLRFAFHGRQRWMPLAHRWFATKENGRSILSKQGVEPKATKEIRFYQELGAPGIYFVTFGAPVAHSLLAKLTDMDVNREATSSGFGTTPMDNVWVASTYFSVVAPHQ